MHLTRVVSSVAIGPGKVDTMEDLRFRFDEGEATDTMSMRLGTVLRRHEQLSKTGNRQKWEDVYSATSKWIKAQDEGKSRLEMAALTWISGLPGSTYYPPTLIKLSIIPLASRLPLPSIFIYYNTIL